MRPRLSRREALAGLAVLALATALGVALASLGWALFVIALAWAVRQQWAFGKFVRWAHRPLRRPRIGNAALQQAGDALHSFMRRSRGRTAKALRQVARFRGVHAALPDAAVLIDKDGVIESFNEASASLLRLGRQDVGNNLGALLRHPDAVSLIRQQTPEPAIEIASPFTEGQRLELRRVRIAEDRDLILARDVTHLNRLLSMRQDFVANVSHELRTPLTVVVGYLEAIAGKSTDEKTLRRVVRKLVSPTKRMEALVDDLLMLTRLESSPAPAPEDLAPIDIGELLESVVEEAAGLATSQHRISHRAQPNLRLLGIEKEMHSACSNLLTNAVKYSPEGGDIEVTWAGNGHGARLEVSDRGVGIPAEHLSRLTERFYRVDLSGARVRGGTGLGLAIVKHVLKRHNSQLLIDSEVGRGSRFHCHFNAAQLQVQPPPPA